MKRSQTLRARKEACYMPICVQCALQYIFLRDWRDAFSKELLVASIVFGTKGYTGTFVDNTFGRNLPTFYI